MTDIKGWIREQLRVGYSAEAIKQYLFNSNYDPGLVDEVLTENLKAVREKAMKESLRKKKRYNKILFVTLIFIFGIMALFGFITD